MKILETLKFIGRIRSNKNRQRGFTLIELVVVLAVLGVLAAIGIPQLTGLQQTAELRGLSGNLASEAGNLFARDLADGSIGGTDTDGSIDDWSDPCTKFTDDELPSIGELPGFKITDGSGEFDFTVPTLNAGEDGEIGSTTCSLTES